MTLRTDLNLPYLLDMPPEAEPDTPLMICLHGRGSNEGDLIGLAPYITQPFIWVSPRAPLDIMDGYEWYHFKTLEEAEPASFDAALAALDAFVAGAARKFMAPPERVWLMGFSQGSILAFAFLLTQPNWAAGLVAQSGYLPPLDGKGLDGRGLRGKPVLITHGLYDPLIPVAMGRAARDALQGLGAAVQYREFPMAHSVSGESLQAIDEWLSARLASRPGL